MTTYDLTPLLRSTIGFDRMTRLMENALRGDDSASSYPPYNIEKIDENEYRIAMAVAGFSEDELEIVVQENALTVRGNARQEAENRDYLYRGIARRAFERRFQLADHIKVKGAGLENGMLSIELVREIPEQMKPRRIEIVGGKNASGKNPQIEHEKGKPKAA